MSENGHTNGTALLGEVVTWDMRSTEISYSRVVDALTHAGLNPDEARELSPKSAFGRACRHLKEERAIDNLLRRDPSAAQCRLASRTRRPRTNEVDPAEESAARACTVGGVTMEVEYREIVGFPGYRVGSDGSVWSCKERGPLGTLGDKWRRLKEKPYGQRGQYLRVQLSRENRLYYWSVHVLVLTVFVGPRPEGMQGCHRDGNPHNNALSNLRWGTRSENECDKVAHGTSNRGSRQGSAKLKEADIPEIRRLLSEGVSQTEVARRFNVGRGAISQISINRTWSHVP